MKSAVVEKAVVREPSRRVLALPDPLCTVPKSGWPIGSPDRLGPPHDAQVIDVEKADHLGRGEAGDQNGRRQQEAIRQASQQKCWSSRAGQA